MKRSKPIARRTHVRPVNRKRKAKNTERAYGIKTGKRAWIVSLPCHFCGSPGFTEPAHAKTGGMGRKSDAKHLIPMCGNRPCVDRPMTRRELGGNQGGWVIGSIIEGCHQRLHRQGVETFQRDTTPSMTLLEIAAAYEEDFQQNVASRSPQTETRGL